MRRIAIVDPNDLSRESLRQMLLGVNDVWLEQEGTRYDFFDDVVRESSPDGVIIDMDGDLAKSQALVKRLTHDFPQLPMMVISSNPQGILQALQSGAKAFLHKPVQLEGLVDQLSKMWPATVVGYSGGPVASGGGSGTAIIAVLGTRGGVGCTSLAVNLAVTLAADPHHKVCLIDLDLALGDADIALDLMADRTIIDLTQNIERLDMKFIDRTLLKHNASNLSVLAHPMHMDEIATIHETHLERIINLLKISYSHLVIDLSKGLLPTDRQALKMADVILLVAQLELSSLRNVVRILMTLGEIEGLNEKVQVVINRVGSDSEGEISLKKAEETIDRPIFWQIPNDSKPMLASRIAGVPLLQHAPRSRAQQSISGLAAQLCGREMPTQQTPGKTGWGRLFGG